MSNATPWSYSSLTAYETCPRRYYLTRVARVVKEKQTEATIHGNEVHKALENYVGGAGPLPPKYEQYKPIADKLRAAPGTKLVEYKFGLTQKLTPTGFFDSNVWMRGVFDVVIVRPSEVIVLDYKTGKRKVDHDQLRLFAGAAMSTWKTAERVKTGYVWLQTGQLDQETFTPDDRQPIFQDFAIRVQRIEESAKSDNWPPKPSGLCKNWCPVGRSHCEYCGS